MSQEDVVKNDKPQKFKIPFVFIIFLLLVAIIFLLSIEKKEMAVVTIEKNGSTEFQLNNQKFSLSCAFRDNEYCFFETNYPEVRHCWTNRNIKNGSESGVCFYSGVCFRVVLLEITPGNVKIKISET